MKNFQIICLNEIFIMTLHIYGARNSQNGMISDPRNRQKMKFSGPRKYRYGPGFFLSPEIINMNKRTFMLACLIQEIVMKKTLN